MSLEQLIALWTHPEYPPESVSEQDLATVEARFSFRFPADYRSAVLLHGLASTTFALLEKIVDDDVDLLPLAEMLGPPVMIEETVAWREMGLSPDLVAFATDGCGNLFCFSTTTIGPVFYFDHDLDRIRQVATSFTAWIEAYCALAKRPN